MKPQTVYTVLSSNPKFDALSKNRNLFPFFSVLDDETFQIKKSADLDEDTSYQTQNIHEHTHICVQIYIYNTQYVSINIHI